MEEFFDSEEAEHGKDPSNPRASQTLPATSSPPHLSLEADLGWGRGGARGGGEGPRRWVREAPHLRWVDWNQDLGPVPR